MTNERHEITTLMIDPTQTLISLVEDFPTDLEGQQEIIGGYLKTVVFASATPHEKGVVAICREDGDLIYDEYAEIALPTGGKMVISGKFFICEYDSEGQCSSLTDDNVIYYSQNIKFY